MLITVIILMGLSFSVLGAEEQAVVDACEAYVSSSPDKKSNYVYDGPFQQGLLWKIEKDDKINHLFGTIHSQDHSITKLPPKVRLALAKSKTLYMESIPDENANQMFIDNMYFKKDEMLSSLLGPSLFRRLQTQLVDYGVSEEFVDKIKPWAAFSLIGRPKPVRAQTLEGNLLSYAQKISLRIMPLESMQEILASLESIPMPDQLIILEDTICNHAKIIRETKRLVNLYIARNLGGIIEFNHEPHHDEAVFERFMQHVLHDRNDKLIKTIKQAFTKGGNLVAIGASHLAADNGLLDRLQADGYEITSVY